MKKLIFWIIVVGIIVLGVYYPIVWWIIGITVLLIVVFFVWLVDKIRTKFDTNGIKIINEIIGVAVILGSVIMLLGTTTNLVRFF